MKNNQFRNKKKNNLYAAYYAEDMGRLVLPGRKPQVIENINTIAFVLADLGYIFVFDKEGNHIYVLMCLSSFYKLLPKDIFLHSHDSYIINMNFIKSFEKRGLGLLVKLIDLNQALVSPDNKEKFGAMLHLSPDAVGDRALLQKNRKK
jgi:DNA-binding LytR/AlgR family response regulator